MKLVSVVESTLMKIRTISLTRHIYINVHYASHNSKPIAILKQLQFHDLKMSRHIIDM